MSPRTSRRPSGGIATSKGLFQQSMEDVSQTSPSKKWTHAARRKAAMQKSKAQGSDIRRRLRFHSSSGSDTCDPNDADDDVGPSPKSSDESEDESFEPRVFAPSGAAGRSHRVNHRSSNTKSTGVVKRRQAGPRKSQDRKSQLISKVANRNFLEPALKSDSHDDVNAPLCSNAELAVDSASMTVRVADESDTDEESYAGLEYISDEADEDDTALEKLEEQAIINDVLQCGDLDFDLDMDGNTFEPDPFTYDAFTFDAVFNYTAYSGSEANVNLLGSGEKPVEASPQVEASLRSQTTDMAPPHAIDVQNKEVEIPADLEFETGLLTPSTIPQYTEDTDDERPASFSVRPESLVLKLQNPRNKRDPKAPIKGAFKIDRKRQYLSHRKDKLAVKAKAMLAMQCIGGINHVDSNDLTV